MRLYLCYLSRKISIIVSVISSFAIRILLACRQAFSRNLSWFTFILLENQYVY